MPNRIQKSVKKGEKAGTRDRQEARTAPQKGGKYAWGNEGQIRDLVENLQEAVIALEARGHILYASPAITRYTGRPAEELIGTAFHQLVHPEDQTKWQEAFKLALAGSPASIEFRGRNSEGAAPDLFLRLNRLAPDGQTAVLSGTLGSARSTAGNHDTAGYRQASFQDLLENIPAAVYIDEVDEVSTTRYMSPQIEVLTGYSPQEWISDPALWLKMIHPEDRPQVETEHLRTNQTGDPFKVDYRIIRKDGQIVWVRDEATLCRGEDGTPICWRGVIMDITNWKYTEQARQAAEEDLRKREEQYRQMIELSPQAILIHSQGRIVYANPAALKLVGARNPEQVMAVPFMDFVHPDSRLAVTKRMRTAPRLGKNPPVVEDKFIRLDGSVIDVEIATMPFSHQGEDAFQMIIKEVSERKQAEALQHAVYQIALATESTRSLQDLFPRIHQIISSVMPAENFYITLYDDTRQVLTFPYFHDAVDEPYLGEIQPGMGLTAYVLRTGKSLLCTQAVHDELEKRGEIKLLGVPSAIWLGVPLIIEGKTIGAMVVQHYSDPNAYSEREQHMLEFVSSQVAIAVTRKQAEEALQNSEASYRGLFNSVKEAIYIQDRNGVFLDVNEGAVQMYGYSRGELIGKTPADVAAPGKNDLKKLKGMLEQAFHGTPQQFEFWGRRKNGEVFPKDVHVTPGMYYGQNVLIAVAQDITERKRAENDLQRQLKELTILQAVTLAGNDTLLIDDLIERVTHLVAETLKLDHVGVLLYDQQAGVLRPHPSFHGERPPDAPQFIPMGEGITGATAQTGLPCRISDTRKEKRYIPAMPGMRSEICVPIRAGSDLIGVLDAESRSPAFFSEADERLFLAIAGSLATAIEKLRLFEAEHTRRQEAENLRQAVAVITSSLALEDVLEAILGSLRQVVAYDSASVILEQPGTGSLEIVAGRFLPSTQRHIGRRIEKGIVWQTLLESRKALIIPDVQEDERFEKWAGTEYIRGWMAVPLVVRDRLIGYLTLDHCLPNTYTDENAILAQNFAFTAAIAVENARLFESEQRRRREEETLREAVSIVASTLDADQSIRLILEQLERVVPYTSASVQILRETALEIVGGRGWLKPEEVIGSQFPIPGDNPNTQVIESRTPLILENPAGRYPIFGQERHHHIQAWMGIPLIVKNNVIGMLSVDSDQPGSFNQESARLAALFASQVAAALENSRLYEEALRASERRAILHRASQAIARAVMDPEQVYQAVHQAAAHLMPVEAFVISLLDEASNQILAAYLFDKGRRWPSLRTPVEAGLSGKVISRGEIVNIHDLTREQTPPGIHFGDDQQEVRSILAVPMRLGEKVIGMLSAQSYHPHTYTEDDQVLLEMLAAHSAVAIENARLYNQTHQRLTELELVNRVSTILREAQTIPEMLPRLLEETRNVFQSDAGAIWLFDPARQVLRISAAQGWFTKLPEQPLAPGEGIPGSVFQSGEGYLSKEIASDPLTFDLFRPHTPPGWSGACVPIRTLQEIIGVLFLAAPLPRQVNPEEIRLLTTICDIAGNAIRRADLYSQTQRQVQRLASLRSIDMAINTILDLRVTLGILLDHILTQLKVDAVDVLLLNPRTQTLQHAASSGFRSEAVNYWQVHIGEDIAGRSIRTRTTIFIPNISEDTVSKRLLSLSNEHFRSYVCVPLVAKGQVKGVLEVFHRSSLEPDADWRTFLETLAGQAAIAIDNSVLFEELQRSNVDLALAYDATIEGWSRALDLRDRETEGHTLRVTELTLQLAQRALVSDPDQVHIRRGALLHDIGKMGVPDSILNKEAALTEEEWQVMRRHPLFAYEMLHPIAYLRPAIDIPYCHHERWNGTGYPRGLRGEEIPIAARLFTVVDVWDALTSNRPYRKAWTKKNAIQFIQKNRGVMFDPKIAEMFLDMMKGELA